MSRDNRSTWRTINLSFSISRIYLYEWAVFRDFTVYNRSILQRDTGVFLWLLNSLNKDTGITNFAKSSPNSIIEIFLSSVNTNVIWKLSCDRVFLIQNFMVTWFTNFVRFLDMCVLKIFFTNVSNNSSKKIMIQAYCNVLHLWLSPPLQSIDMPFSSVVRWQRGFSSTW